MSISLEALFAIIININHIYFCIFMHVIKLMKGKRKFTPWRLSESWYDWPSVLAIVLILVVCPTKLHKNNPHFMRFKKDKPDGNNIACKNNFWYFFIAQSSTY